MDGWSLQPCVKHELKKMQSKCLSLIPFNIIDQNMYCYWLKASDVETLFGFHH